MKGKLRRISLSIVLGLSIAFSWLQPLDTSAITQVDAGLKRALIAFATARTLNAVISVAQETQISFQLGVGATLAPGQILDPANDLIEQFGDLMLAASVGFGIMHFLIKIGAFWFFSLMLTAFGVVWLWLRWQNQTVPEWLMKAVIVLLFVRFSIPVVMIGSDLAFKQFMEPKYNQSMSAIKISSDEINKSGKAKREANGFIDTITNFPNSIKNAKDEMEKKLDELQQSADHLADHVVNLIVIFIMQTIVIPVVFLWILYMLGLGALRSINSDNASTRKAAAAIQ